MRTYRAEGTDVDGKSQVERSRPYSLIYGSEVNGACE